LVLQGLTVWRLMSPVSLLSHIRECSSRPWNHYYTTLLVTACRPATSRRPSPSIDSCRHSGYTIGSRRFCHPTGPGCADRLTLPSASVVTQTTPSIGSPHPVWLSSTLSSSTRARRSCARRSCGLAIIAQRLGRQTYAPAARGVPHQDAQEGMRFMTEDGVTITPMNAVPAGVTLDARD